MANITLDTFYEWYENNQDNIIQMSSSYIKENEILRSQFLKEWPLDRLKTMTIDDYVIGKGAQNASLCYLIEQGKYKHLFMGIGGGGASKFGIYWNKGKGSYVDQANQIINDDELDERFSKLKNDLFDIIVSGVKLDFENPIFNTKHSQNEFINRSAVVTKLLCIYSEGNPYFGINNNSQKMFWNQLVPQMIQGGPYRQNYEIAQKVREKYPHLENQSIGGILHEFFQTYKEENGDSPNQNVSFQDAMVFQYSKQVKNSKNIILRGAPGTGKTFLARQIAAELVSKGNKHDYSDLTDAEKERIGFVQFHPSYDYTDFVEGLRPISNDDGQVSFELKDGIFKSFCERAAKKSKVGGHDNFDEAWDSYLEFINQSDQKEYVTKTSYLTVNSRQNLSVNYDSGTSGWTLPRPYVYELYKDETYDKQTYYRSSGRTVLKTLKQKFGLLDYQIPTDTNAKDAPLFVFIIDEINRGEISKIFGELFYAIDPGYRGPAGAVSTQYANMHESDEKFYIPENVYIIGTMNDIDRSVDTFDFAMRRRFRFIEIKAEDTIDMWEKTEGFDDSQIEEAKRRLLSLNRAIEEIPELNTNYHVGPSYFLKLPELDYQYDTLWTDYLEPLLQEYLRGTYQEIEHLETLKKAYDYLEEEAHVD
ncbi:AAA family ATPase [Streptococcus moroccensis]|uniref:5-methylcytosine-specific restriction endonuclease McrBC GTP-binding regulatory subunit McrB n=1 Tax=Streptococcus moroccensis TaxID=1451356 RepID=A0ABT9YR78_9STRE|nr:AAA family ATPase [Streptococcus moroccensis]MDQ0222504.1 5-methylcytosine-specific restriction endonuclease McrBC GTP-binding regulatory subunit McrB [Streptococcus moroccensis]